MITPLSTYRLQLRNGMTFERAASIIPHLAGLGISHLYLSPIFEAVRGSTHGYDVSDNAALAGELGGEAAFRKLTNALARHGIRLLLDFVPNHMAASPLNPWWHNVLEWGETAQHAQHFDIDWSAPKLIVPVLASDYATALAHGELALTFDRDTGTLSMKYGELSVALTPPSYADVLGRTRNSGLLDLAQHFAGSTPETAPRHKAELAKVAQNPSVSTRLSTALDEMGADRAALHALHERQVWRLTHWRLAREMLTHRRFFEISDLVGLRVEDPQVFEDVHARVFKLIEDGSVHGLRLDHIDGLADPKGYFVWLQETLGKNDPFYLLVEKILGPGESLREDWPVAGTTGYEFIRDLGNLLVDASGEEAMTEAYQSFIGQPVDYDALVRSIKRRTLTHNFAGELRNLVQIAHTAASCSLATRDLGPDALRCAIIELASALPIYRTYVTAPGGSEADRSIVEAAAADAKATRQCDGAEPIDFIRRMALLDVEEYEVKPHALEFAVRFQQATGPLMAKAVEDTAFYRYNRLLALNEVGGEPDEFGAPVDVFHHSMELRHRQQPHGLSTTATHDTKRGEDARARLYALSEMPRAWSSAANRWRELNAPLRTTASGRTMPDPDFEWSFYQSLAGAWPLNVTADDSQGLDRLAERMVQFALKAVREAKLHTSWTLHGEAYERAVEHFARSALDPKISAPFISDLCDFIQPLMVVGALNSLSQLVIKLAAPGVPDIYQGTELWDFSLVDPDNRRPVDFDGVARLAGGTKQHDMSALLEDWRSGAIKLHILRAGLQLRSRMPALFSNGDYVPLKVTGEHSHNVVAFARTQGDHAVLAIVPRATVHLLESVDIPKIPPARWGTTAVILSPELARHNWIDVCTEELIEAKPQVALGGLLHICPISLMLSRGTRGS